jgi:8-oxo-dGTP diphosphatase
MPSVVFVLLRGDRVLMEQRPDPGAAEEWLFPGGKIQPGETPAEALRREMQEELGVEAGSLQPLRCPSTYYEHRDGARDLLMPYLVSSWSGPVPIAIRDTGHALAWRRLAAAVASAIPCTATIACAVHYWRRARQTAAADLRPCSAAACWRTADLPGGTCFEHSPWATLDSARVWGPPLPPLPIEGVARV